MPDFSFPAWLRETHSFADSLAKGAAVGSAIANNIYRNRALSAQIQMEGEQMAYRNRDLDMKQELFKLKLDGEMNEKQGMVEVGKVLSEIAANGDWTNPGARAKFFGVVAKYPNITKSPIYDNLLQNFQAADNAKSLMERERLRLEKGFSPGPLQKDMEYYQSVLAEGDPELVDLTRSILQSKAQKSGFSVKFGPGGTVESVDYGPQAKGGPAGAPTVAVKTDLQKDINNTRQALPLMADLEKNLRAEDLGIRGVVGETVMDRLLPQFGAGTLDPQRTDNRTKLRTLVQSMLRQISPDNRFTNEDRERIEKIMPDLGVLENVDRAKQVLSEMSKVFSERNVRDMQALGSPLEMPQMSNEEIAAAVRMNLIDRNVALEFFRKNRANQ